MAFRDTRNPLHVCGWPTVVGYNKVDGDQGTYKLMGASFFAVGNAQQKVGLSTLTITGYEDSSYLTDDGEFNASFQLLNGDGSPKETYLYSNTSQDGETWDGAVWMLSDRTPVTSENEVWLESGEGLWLTMPSKYSVDSLKLGSSGQVIAGDSSVEGDQGTYRAICNPFPATVKLSECEIQGYEDSQYLTEDGEFNASFQILNGDGSPKNTYLYGNTSEDGETWAGATWMYSDRTPITSENDVSIDAGQGIWLTLPGKYSCDCISMVFPKVID